MEETKKNVVVETTETSPQDNAKTLAKDLFPTLRSEEEINYGHPAVNAKLKEYLAKWEDNEEVAEEKSPQDIMRDLLLSLQEKGCEFSVSRRNTEFTLNINTPVTMSTQRMSFDINNSDSVEETITTLMEIISMVEEGLKQKEAIRQWEGMFNGLIIL